MMLLWQLVAAIIDPERNLVNGVAVVVVIYTVHRVIAQLIAYRSTVIRAVKDCLDDELNQRLKTTMDKMNSSDDAIEALEGDGGIPTIENVFDAIASQVCTICYACSVPVLCLCCACAVHVPCLPMNL